jgi:hypothetical protein
MTALDSITTSSGDIKAPLSPTLPAVSRRKRRVTLAAAVATVGIASAVAVFASQRDAASGVANAHPEAAATAAVDSGPEATAAASARATAPVPVVLTRADSLAIAEAVRKRLAEEERTHGTRQIVRMTDSLVALARRVAIDSIIKATLPAGMAVPVWSETAPTPPRPALMPRQPSTIRRVAVVEPRQSRQPGLNEFAKVLSDSIRRSIARRNGYRVIDPDSVSAAIGVSRARSEIERTLKPDVLIMPTFVGAGDELTALITLREVGNPQMGTRIASGKFRVDNPEASIPALVGLVGAQLDHLLAFTFRVAPSVRVRGTNER